MSWTGPKKEQQIPRTFTEKFHDIPEILWNLWEPWTTVGCNFLLRIKQNRAQARNTVEWVGGWNHLGLLLDHAVPKLQVTHSCKRRTRSNSCKLVAPKWTDNTISFSIKLYESRLARCLKCLCNLLVRFKGSARGGVVLTYTQTKIQTAI